MRYGTYTCGLAAGGLEYGFTFGEAANAEDADTTGPCEIGDSEFDVVLGVACNEAEMHGIEAQWARYEWVAKAVIEASKRVEVPNELV